MTDPHPFEPADDAVLTLSDHPVQTAALPFIVHNPSKLPALLAAFAKAQGEYTTIVRDKKVTQKLKDRESGNYNGKEITFFYADMAAILAAAIPALSKNGISFSQPLMQTADGTQLHTILAHAEGCMIVTTVKLTAVPDIKAFGTQITYLRRYMAGPALGVSAEDDADQNGGEGDDDFGTYGGGNGPTPAPAPARARPVRKSAPAGDGQDAVDEPKITAVQLKMLVAKTRALDMGPDQVNAMLTRFKVQGGLSTGITVAQHDAIVAELDRAGGG